MEQSDYILGISAFYHDAAACLLRSGEIVGAAQEERFTRKKHDPAFPENAIRFCLDEAGIGLDRVRAVVFYDKPFLTFERLLETYLSFAPRGFPSFILSMPVWLKEKLFLRQILKKELRRAFSPDRELPPLLFSEHHRSHAASAFFASPFESAAVLCMDGVGEWATTSAWMGRANALEPLWELRFPHSLGMLYSAFTYHAGFKVNSGEYKLMGLAPYGKPRFRDAILGELMDLKEDGTFRLNLDYFDYCTGLRMTHRRFDRLFEGPPRKPESRITQREMDLAASVQSVTEEIVLRLARKIRAETGARNLCLAGGVALNCVANGRLLRERIFDEIWIQPAAGDAGGAVGCALAAWHEHFGEKRSAPRDLMKGAFLGPESSDAEIARWISDRGIPAEKLSDDELFSRAARELADQKVLGWFQGRMEFGPRALGGRSILGDPRSPKMQSLMNLKIKKRESFRPFAPSVLAEKAGQYFDLETESPYMMLVAPVRESLRAPVPEGAGKLWGIDLIHVPRSSIPAVTHLDYSARVQTVHAETAPRYHRLLRELEKQTGCAVLLNTSFNVRGEPIVCSLEDAYRCFMGTDMDILVLGNHVLTKGAQPKTELHERYEKNFDLD